MKADSKKYQGFTLIEVLLVFAIAGLIFLMTFIALPALQRTARDTERKQDISYLLEKIKKYQTNNRGALPDLDVTDKDEVKDPTTVDGDSDHSAAAASSWAGFYRDYLEDQTFIDPLGSKYSLSVTQCKGDVAGSQCNNPLLKEAIDNKLSENVVYIVTQAKCAEDEKIGVLATGNPRKTAVLYSTEQSGVYCANT